MRSQCQVDVNQIHLRVLVYLKEKLNRKKIQLQILLSFKMHFRNRECNNKSTATFVSKYSILNYKFQLKKHESCKIYILHYSKVLFTGND